MDAVISISSIGKRLEIRNGRKKQAPNALLASSWDGVFWSVIPAEAENQMHRIGQEANQKSCMQATLTMIRMVSCPSWILGGTMYSRSGSSVRTWRARCHSRDCIFSALVLDGWSCEIQGLQWW